MLETIQRVSTGPAERGLHLYQRGYDADPEFVSYTEFPARIAAHADYFREQGIGPGTRVVVPFDTSISVIMSFLGLVETGALPLSIKPHLPFTPLAPYEEFVNRVVPNFDARYILDVPTLAEIDVATQRIALPQDSIRLDGATLRTPADDELAFVQLSSGSTSFPKGIPVRHGMLRRNLSMITRTDERPETARSGSWLPLYHDMGLVGGLLSSLYVGSDLCLSSPPTFLFDARGWWEHLGREQIFGTVIPNFAVDYSLKMMSGMETEDIEAIDLSALEAIYLGSEPINIPNLEEFLDLMAPAGLRRDVFMPCYGMAEVVLIVSSRPLHGEVRVVASPSSVPSISVGRPMAEFDVRLRNEQGELVGEDELGEVELSGGSLAVDYFESGVTLREPDGYYRTGDVGFMNDGELFITGRNSDRIKVNGQSLFAADFEQAVERLDFVREGRTVVFQAAADIVVLTEVNRRAKAHGAQCPAIIVSHLVDQLGVTVQPDNIHFLAAGQLSRTSSGKLRRREIAGNFQHGKLDFAPVAEA